MKKKYKHYIDYLRSEKWKQVKQDYANSNSSELCTLCGSDDNLEHHHWKYPKDWNDDSHENIIRVCKDCHSFIHDGESKQYNTLIDFMADIIPCLMQRENENGTVIGQDDVLMRALQVVDVVEERSLTDKSKRSVYRLKAGDKISQPCNFLPASYWGNLING